MGAEELQMADMRQPAWRPSGVEDVSDAAQSAVIRTERIKASMVCGMLSLMPSRVEGGSD
eukprot:2565322-Rhodomonas_salina.1